jgi:hypothetical protein
MVALGVYLLLAAYAVLFVYGERDPQDPNPGQSAFLSWFGTLKRFRNVGGAAAVKLHWPSSYLVENPRGYRISGAQTRAVLDLLREGDILLRGYEGYVDGEFIRRSSVTSGHGFQPGWFTHAALYVGALTKADRTHVPDAFRDNAAYFSSGPQMVIHSMAKGVHAEDILSFLRCDYLAVLRLPPELSLPPGQTADLRSPRALTKPPAPSDPLVAQLLLQLQSGGSVPSAQVIAAARLSALEKIGEAYDFDCSDTTEFNRFSCAELVYYCLRGVLGALELRPLPHALHPLVPFNHSFKMLERITITPDDFHDLLPNGALEHSAYGKTTAAWRRRRRPPHESQAVCYRDCNAISATSSACICKAIWKRTSGNGRSASRAGWASWLAAPFRSSTCSPPAWPHSGMLNCGGDCFCWCQPSSWRASRAGWIWPRA